MIVDNRTNTLIIKELPNYIDTVLAVIDTLDVPEPQVMIEAKIVETTKQFSRSLGISWGFDAVSDPAHGNTTGLEFPSHGTVDGGVGLLTGGANGFIDLTLGNILDTFTLDARLQERRPGARVRLAVFRGDELREIPVTLGAKKPVRLTLKPARGAGEIELARRRAWLGAPEAAGREKPQPSAAQGVSCS